MKSAASEEAPLVMDGPGGAGAVFFPFAKRATRCIMKAQEFESPHGERKRTSGNSSFFHVAFNLAVVEPALEERKEHTG